MDLASYRSQTSELERSESIMKLMLQKRAGSDGALDVGARDGHFSKLLSQYFTSVTAIDLEKPDIRTKGVTCIQGDTTNLAFSDNTFDVVLCSEVLEHIPCSMLQTACNELTRVTKKHLIIGVPFEQDTRIGKTTCLTCGKENPPWGHVNEFTRTKLELLFSSLEVDAVELCGKTKDKTNFLSSFLLKLAGNPYGTYEQEEPCIHCHERLLPPPRRRAYQKALTRISLVVNKLINPRHDTKAKWIHIRFKKP